MENKNYGKIPPALHNSRRIIRSLKAKEDAKRTLFERVADWMTATFGSIPFLIVNISWFALWIILNLGLIPGLVPFDPFPFGLLTMIVSLEAIILAIFVLISQNRAAKVDDLRDEIDLQVDIITEQELTKLMAMVAKIMEKNGIDISRDKVLKKMLEPANVAMIEKALERQVVEK